MAIKLSKATNKGVTASHWKIISFSLNKLGTTVNIQYSIAGYYNEDVYDSGALPISSYDYTFLGDPDDVDLVLYSSIALSWNNGLLSTNFSNVDPSLLPNYQINLSALSDKILTACYVDAKTKDFEGGVDC